MIGIDGSIPSGSIYIAPSPSGKVQDFDSCIRWFESSRGSLWDISSVGSSNELLIRRSCVQITYVPLNLIMADGEK